MGKDCCARYAVVSDGMKSVSKTRDVFRFEIIKQSSKSQARVGKIYTPHGIVNTPAFVPVGTNATLKAVTHQQAEQIGVELMFSNTYHIVHPGADVIEGLVAFTNGLDGTGLSLLTREGSSIFAIGRQTRK